MHPEIFNLTLAWILDAHIGDPLWLPWPHPVQIIGRFASLLEKNLRKPTDPSKTQTIKGAFFLFLTMAATLLSGLALLETANAISPIIGRALRIYIYYSCLSTKCLDSEAKEISTFLSRGDLSGARKRTARIVGRDTESLSGSEIARATIESVSENASDGVIAPLFYIGLGAVFGVAPLTCLAYKCINTMDSMVGYQNERYEFFGKVSARVDDAANWVPARITAVLTWTAAQLLWRKGLQSMALTFSDAENSASPNAGYPEAAFAGALGVKLGGTNYYGGKPRNSPPIGAKGNQPKNQDIQKAIQLLWGVSLGGLALTAAMLILAG